MVLGPVITQVFKSGIKLAGRYYRLEGKAFNKLYTGFPRSRVIGRGVRHGLTAGSIAGSLITNADDTPGNGIQTPFRKQSPTKARKSYKTRQGFARSNRFRCPKPYKYRRRR